MLKRRSLKAALLAAATVLSTALLQAQAAKESPSDEYLLLGSPNRGAGEPWVFVNPKDSNNIIVVGMATLNRLPAGEAPLPHGGFGTPPTPASREMRVKELSTPDGSRTDIAVTRDGGKTWSFSEDNFRKVLEKNRCSDSFAGSGPDGALYYGCLAYLNRGSADFDANGSTPGGEAQLAHGGTAIARSEDRGQTWTSPTWVHPLQSPALYSPSIKPDFTQVSPVDRPVFVADAATGTIYVSGSGGGAYATASHQPNAPNGRSAANLPGGARGFHTFLRASHDGGKKWGVIYPTDQSDYPGGAFGMGIFSAAFGHLAVIYTTRSVPASVNAICPCTVLGISQDDGKTFDYKIIPPLPKDPNSASAAARSPMAGFGGTMVSADPTKEGRYAVARTEGKRTMISVTDDGGTTWRPPVIAAELPANASFSHQAMKYSPKGDIGLIWKQMYPDRTFDVWSAVSRDGGQTFKTVRISHAVSPTYNPERGNFLFGDDLSSLDMDSQYLYAVWGDNRSGFEGTWFGRVPLNAY